MLNACSVAAKSLLTTDISAGELILQPAQRTEGKSVCERAIGVILLQSMQIAAVVIFETFGNRRIPVQWKITYLDHKYNMRQDISPESYLPFFQAFKTSRDPIIYYVRVVEKNRAVIIQNLQAKLEIRADGFVRVLAVDKTEVNLVGYCVRVNRSCTTVKRRNLLRIY
jgi:hypothetical protein